MINHISCRILSFANLAMNDPCQQVWKFKGNKKKKKKKKRKEISSSF